MMIEVYLDDGNVFSYGVSGGEAKAREHAHAIATTGYRHTTADVLTVFPPHRIKKVKVLGPVTSNYQDEVRGT